jgi:hypothetical protein
MREGGLCVVWCGSMRKVMCALLLILQGTRPCSGSLKSRTYPLTCPFLAQLPCSSGLSNWHQAELQIDVGHKKVIWLLLAVDRGIRRHTISYPSLLRSSVLLIPLWATAGCSIGIAGDEEAARGWMTAAVPRTYACCLPWVAPLEARNNPV